MAEAVSSILMAVLEVVLIGAAALLTKYAVPYLQSLIDTDALDTLKSWVESAVLFAQQTMQEAAGEEKKSAVLEFLSTILDREGIDATEEELDVLVEAAVKTMKMAEGEVIEIQTGETLATDDLENLDIGDDD